MEGVRDVLCTYVRDTKVVSIAHSVTIHEEKGQREDQRIFEPSEKI